MATITEIEIEGFPLRVTAADPAQCERILLAYRRVQAAQGSENLTAVLVLISELRPLVAGELLDNAALVSTMLPPDMALDGRAIRLGLLLGWPGALPAILEAVILDLAHDPIWRQARATIAKTL